MEHLTEVVVAVDALERRPRRLGGGDAARQSTRLADLGELGRLGDGGLEAGVHLGDDGPPPAPRSWARCRALGQGPVDLGGGLPEGSGRLAEVGARLGGPERDAPGVLDAGEELLGEGEVPGCRVVALRAGVRPAPGDPPDHRGNPPRARVDEGALEHDVGVVARGEHPEDLDDERGVVPVGEVAVEDHRGVRLLARQHPRGPHAHLGAPARLRHPDDRLLDGVRALRGLGAHAALDELEELGGVHGVVRGVVDPPVAERRVLHRADEGMVRAAERLAAVGEGHLVDERGRRPPRRRAPRVSMPTSPSGSSSAPRGEETEPGCCPFAAYQRWSPIHAWTSSVLPGVRVAVRMISATAAPGHGVGTEVTRASRRR